MFTKKSYIMKNKKEIEGMFDDDVVNSDHQDSVDNNDVQALPPKSDETEQFGIMEAALIFQRGKDELEKNTNVFVDMQKQFVSRMERTTKDVRVSLDEADRRLILNYKIPKSYVICTPMASAICTSFFVSSAVLH